MTLDFENVDWEVHKHVLLKEKYQNKAKEVHFPLRSTSGSPGSVLPDGLDGSDGSDRSRGVRWVRMVR